MRTELNKSEIWNCCCGLKVEKRRVLDVALGGCIAIALVGSGAALLTFPPTKSLIFYYVFSPQYTLPFVFLETGITCAAWAELYLTKNDDNKTSPEIKRAEQITRLLSWVTFATIVFSIVLKLVMNTQLVDQKSEF